MASLSELAAVREDFAGWLTEITASEEKVEDLAVVISELGANAVRGTPKGRDPATVSAWLEDDGGSRVVVLEVANHVEEVTIPDADWDLEDPLRNPSKGLEKLLSVTGLSDHVTIER